MDTLLWNLVFAKHCERLIAQGFGPLVAGDRNHPLLRSVFSRMSAAGFDRVIFEIESVVAFYRIIRRAELI